MKKLLSILFFSLTLLVRAQDTSPIQVDLPDNPRLQWSGSAVKQRAIVLHWQPLINGTKEFYIKVRIQYWSNNSGAYGSLITSLIQADGTLSSDQQSQLLQQYGDKFFEHQSTSVCTDASGNIQPCTFQADGVTLSVGLMYESAYWQQFKLNQVSGVTSISTQGAFDAEFKIITAVVNKMSTRKNW
jgi:hypothetical protein